MQTSQKMDNSDCLNTWPTSNINIFKIYDEIPATNIPALLQIHLHAEGTSWT
jgi:hypothetical protein